jgi:adenylate kinase
MDTNGAPRVILCGSKIRTPDFVMLNRILVALAFLLTSTVFVAQTPSAPGAPPAPSGPPLIILIGPPLSGKTTFVESITKTYGIPAISIEDLIKDNAVELEKLRGEGISMAEMRYDPAMSRYMNTRLRAADLTHGIALDGYPATLYQAQELAKIVPGLGLKPIAFQLDVPDDVVRARAKKSGQQSNQPEILEQRIKDYHREMDTISLYYPNAKIVVVDANKPEPEAWKEIQAGLNAAGIKPAAK